MTFDIPRHRVAILFGSLVAVASLSNLPTLQAKEATPIQFFPGKASTTPFSPAVRVGRELYLSGQLGLLPGTQTLAPGGIQAETRQAMQNIQSQLTSSGYSMNDLVKCTVFLADMTEFPAFNTQYLSFLKQPYPVRSTVGVRSLAFNGRVEIECMATR
jgi:2-iminobutanoate/2-iminopropanoate deaminase